MASAPVSSDRGDWQCAAESIVVKIRWFGIVMGYVLVQSRDGLRDAQAVRAILALGAVYALVDTIYQRRGQIFLGSWPLFVAVMETTFIALLCYYDTGLESPFRWYFLLSSLCVAIRYNRVSAALTLTTQLIALLILAVILQSEGMTGDLHTLPLTFVVVAWATWAAAALADTLKATGQRLEAANTALERHQAELERRIAQQVEALRASQARLIQQEKMAAFGLLSAGIAHEVGNPLAALSSLVQMLRRRRPDPYTETKLALAESQLDRIRRTIGELVAFSRPASPAIGPFPLDEAVQDALDIAKYYHPTKDRRIENRLGAQRLHVHGVRDHLTQVVLNLVLNAIDATTKGGRIELLTEQERSGWVRLLVRDDGRGLSEPDQARLFQPHFTTKPNGTGLGLYVSRTLVEEMGGRIGVESSAGSGATFWIELRTIEQAIPAPARASIIESEPVR
ncbi:MAG: hypothetical protein KatS3mg108_1143 [Isosphaeraceae bacterium]|jgi:signal transduction histidine kinase|nr:MAG: hypothetical protein KatS3mg108_1143 [Isosphaeraceae bacterium]